MTSAMSGPRSPRGAGATTNELMARLSHASPQAALRSYQHAAAYRDRAIANQLDAVIEQARGRPRSSPHLHGRAMDAPWSSTRRGPSLGATPRPGPFKERATRIELAFSAWEADVLPLNYARGFCAFLLREGPG